MGRVRHAGAAGTALALLVLASCGPAGVADAGARPASAAAFPVAGTDRVVARADMPSRVRTICLANAGNPAAQEAAFAADPGFAPPGVVETATMRNASFAWRAARIGGGGVTSGGSPLDGCTINDAGLAWRVLPDGRVAVSTSRADDW